MTEHERVRLGADLVSERASALDRREKVVASWHDPRAHVGGCVVTRERCPQHGLERKSECLASRQNVGELGGRAVQRRERLTERASLCRCRIPWQSDTGHEREQRDRPAGAGGPELSIAGEERTGHVELGAALGERALQPQHRNSARLTGHRDARVVPHLAEILAPARRIDDVAGRREAGRLVEAAGTNGDRVRRRDSVLEFLVTGQRIEGEVAHGYHFISS
ncbi:MAG TPA: hypothetical protein VEK78_02730 [Gemmatimonadales bacterium]|nr:hypothetical protein [Gemmatimonadales bacterium]